MKTPLAVPIPEACRLIGVGRTTLYRLIESRQINPRKIGRRTRRKAWISMICW